MATVIDLKLLPKQRQFFQATEPEVLYSGAFGAGKSRALCYKLVWQHAIVPGNFVGLCRKTFTSLRHSTLRTLLEPESGLPPVLPEGSYEHNRSEHTIKINGGGTIYYFGLDTAETIGSVNFGAVAVDEITQINEHEYLMLQGRLRNTIDPCRQIFGATNPESTRHFLFLKFFKHPVEGKTKAIQTKSSDNVFLPDDYLEQLSAFSGQHKARYVEGQWGAFEGLVYDIFDRDTHVVHRPLTDFQDFYIGADAGYTHPAVALLLGMDGDGRLHICDEWYRRKALPQSHADAIEAMYRGDGGRKQALAVYADPSAAGLKAELENRGLFCEEVDNDRLPGVAAVREMLAFAGDGKPRHTVEPHCENTITEFMSYKYKIDRKTGEPTDEPEKSMDDAMDSDRYPVYALCRQPGYQDVFVPKTDRVFPRARGQEKVLRIGRRFV